MRLLCLSSALSLAVALAACGGVNSPSSNVSEVFSGTLPVGGAASHQFTASKNGEFSVTLTTLTPATGNAIQIVFGLLVGNGCQTITIVPATRGQTPLAGPIDKGVYCLTLLDPGTLTQTATYSISVSHP